MKVLVTSLESVAQIKPFQAEGMETLFGVFDDTFVFVDGVLEWFESTFLPRYTPYGSVNDFLPYIDVYVGSDFNSTLNKLKLKFPEVSDGQLIEDASVLFAVAMQFTDSNGSNVFKYSDGVLKTVGSVKKVKDIGTILADAGAASPPL